MSINSGVCRIYTACHSVHLHYHCVSIHPPSFLGDVLGGRDQGCLVMHLETEMDWTQRCTWRLWLDDFGDAIGDRDRVNSEMHLEAGIERVGRYTWRSQLIKIGGVLWGDWYGGNWSKGGWSGGNSCEGGQSGGSQSGGSESAASRLSGMLDGSWDSIHWFTSKCANVENGVQHGPLRAERLAGSRKQAIVEWCSTQCMQYSVYAVLGVCSTRCMQYSVYALLGVCCTQCMQYSVYVVFSVCSTWCMQYLVYAVLSVNSWSWYGEMEKDDFTVCS